MTNALAPNQLRLALQSRPCIVARAPVSLVRCYCRECIGLDRKHPNEGYQLTFVGGMR